MWLLLLLLLLQLRRVEMSFANDELFHVDNYCIEEGSSHGVLIVTCEKLKLSSMVVD